jgi:hypothetical protein
MRPEDTASWTTLAEIRAAEKARGGHWFDKDIMKSTKTRLFNTVYGGNWFIYSIQQDYDRQRQWGVAHACKDGAIYGDALFEMRENADDFMSWMVPSARQAEREALKLEAGTRKCACARCEFYSSKSRRVVSPRSFKR